MHDLGRRVGGGTWQVSCVALQMFLNGDMNARAAYHAGDRGSPTVVSYYEGAGLLQLVREWSRLQSAREHGA